MKTRSTLLWIAGRAGRQGGKIFLLTVCSMVAGGLYVVPALLSRRIINAAVDAESVTAAGPEILFCGGLLLATVFLQLCLAMLCTHLRAVISGKAEMALRQHFFDTMLRKSYPEISAFHSGELMNRFTSDVDVVVSGLTTVIPQALSICTKLLVGLILLISFSPQYALVSVVLGLLVLAFALMLRPLYKRMHKAVQAAAGEMRSFSQECTENLVVVKSFSGNRQILGRLLLYMQRLYRIKIRRSVVHNITTNGVALLFTSAYYGTLLWGALSIARGSMDYGTLMAFLQVVSQIQSPFLNASGLITQLYAAQASCERLMEMEALADEKTPQDFSAQTVYQKMEALSARDLSFAYDKDTIIENVSFSIPKGSFTAITGTSGTGKSTLFRLLLGLFSPKAGTLAVQLREGEMVLDASTRPFFAYVPQGHLLLAGTVRENIKFINPTLSDEKMEEAAKTACIYDFIMSLPQGFDTPLGEHGSGISEGQMQRIAIARALCTDAPILLLDECTSALDSETEDALLQNLAALKTKTVLFISHKNAVVSVCDRHLMLENGSCSMQIMCEKTDER